MESILDVTTQSRFIKVDLFYKNIPVNGYRRNVKIRKSFLKINNDLGKISITLKINHLIIDGA